MRKRIIFFAVLSFLIFLTGCSWESLSSTSQENTYANKSTKTDNGIKFEVVESDVYFSQQTGQSKNLASVKTIFCDKNHNLVLTEVFSNKTLDIAKRGLELSIFSASRQRNLRTFGLFCIFPDSVKINFLKIEKNAATIDLSSEFYKQKYLDFYIKAITFYLTSFENIDRVYFYNEGKSYTNKAFERKKAGQVIIFVPQKVLSEIFLVPKWIDIPDKFKNIPMTFAQKSLINSLSYRFSKLNGLKLNNVNLKEKTLYIDLSKELLNLKGTAQVDIVISSICFTAREIDKALKYLKISIDGKELYLDQYDLREKIDMDQFKFNSLKIRL
uniref:GerMN domain-containing protein n=1 Tax=Caldicellulosiruptor owensensis TaxID=55205 RepID=A0A7C5V510_9FIRM